MDGVSSGSLPLGLIPKIDILHRYIYRSKARSTTNMCLGSSKLFLAPNLLLFATYNLHLLRSTLISFIPPTSETQTGEKRRTNQRKHTITATFCFRSISSPTAPSVQLIASLRLHRANMQSTRNVAAQRSQSQSTLQWHIIFIYNDCCKQSIKMENARGTKTFPINF